MNEADASHPSLADLAAFDAGSLPAALREEIERHLAGCPECGRRVDALPEDPFVARLRASAGDTEPAASGRPTSEAGGAAAPPDVPAVLAGHPRYHVLESLGAGGMGAVYKAVHRLMDRVVALKVLHRHFTDRPAFVERFRREVRAAARLSHPHIVLAHDAEQAGDVHFLVMEYVPGTSLDRVVARHGPLPVRDACEYVRQAALGLEHAHEHGLVHRDVKPANLMLTPEGQVKVLDFGLAHLARGADEGAESSLPPGAVVGTPDYTAPEQARDARSADVRADVYGLGCTLWFLLTGRPPFPGGTALEKLLAHQDRPPRPIAELRGDVPAPVADLLARMLAKDPARRPATPADVARELGHYLFTDAATMIIAPGTSGDFAQGWPPHAGTHPGRGRRRSWLLAASALLAGVGVASVLAVNWPREGRPPVETPPTGDVPPKPAAPIDSLALATAEQMTQLKERRRDQALAWLRDNNAWGPDTPLVQHTAAEFSRGPGEVDGFLILLGPRLVRSRQPALLAGHLGGFFVFPLDAAQARSLELKEGLRTFYAYRKITTPRRATPRVRLSGLAIDHAGDLVLDRGVTGSVAYEVEGPPVAPPFAVRLSFYREKAGRHMVLVWFKQRPLEGRGWLPFACPPLATPTIRPRSPFVLFAEVCTDPGGVLVVESDAAATLVEAATRARPRP